MEIEIEPASAKAFELMANWSAVPVGRWPAAAIREVYYFARRASSAAAARAAGP